MSHLVPFLLGVIAMSSLAAGAYFVKFWRGTRDTFFLAFAAFFLIEAANRTVLVFFTKPNEGSPWIYIIRLLALLGILAAVLHKNCGGPRR